MNLKEFLDMWTRKNLAVIVCRSSAYDDMFDVIDDINDGKTKIITLEPYILFAIIPYYSQFIEAFYIKEYFMKSKVTNFYISDTALVVWIDDHTEKKGD